MLLFLGRLLVIRLRFLLSQLVASDVPFSGITSQGTWSIYLFHVDNVNSDHLVKVLPNFSTDNLQFSFL